MNIACFYFFSFLLSLLINLSILRNYLSKGYKASDNVCWCRWQELVSLVLEKGLVRDSQNRTFVQVLKFHVWNKGRQNWARRSKGAHLLFLCGRWAEHVFTCLKGWKQNQKKNGISWHLKLYDIQAKVSRKCYWNPVAIKYFPTSLPFLVSIFDESLTEGHLCFLEKF